MRSLSRALIRVSAFVRKEIFEILRQPRLILTLVLGPFLILLLFGIGYQNKPRVLRTVFVVQPDSALEREIEKFKDLGPQLDLVGIENDPANAERLLRQREIDLVVVTPPDAYEKILNNEQATFTLYHNEIDPLQVDYIRVFGRVYIDEVNRRVLRTITDRGQDQAIGSREQLSAAHASATAMRTALEQGDVLAARQHQQQLDQELDILEQTVGTSLGLLEGVEETLGTAQNTDTEQIQGNLAAARQESLDLGTIESGKADYTEEAQRATRIEEQLASMDSQMGQLQQVNSEVLVSPFRSDTQSIATLQLQLAHYFAPAVIVLLLQHLAITFAALSIVREVRLGTVEVFRVSPVSAGETLLGKYLSYMLFGTVLALLLTVVLVSSVPLPIPGLAEMMGGAQPALGLGVPMIGQWANYALVVGALIFTSLGIGFVVSLIVDTDSQAVQYSMIVLLTSVFFSGFFLSIQALWAPVRVVSWMLPATYAILLLQDIMLRGSTGDPVLLTSLLAIGIGLYLLSWFLLRRVMQRR